MYQQPALSQTLVTIVQPGMMQPGYPMPMNAAAYGLGEYRNPGGFPIGVGLEYLAHVDQLIVQQQIEMLEIFAGFERNNRYVIRNAQGQQLFFAAEDSDCFTRNCCGPLRQFEMHILNSYGEILHLHRPFECQACCCPCCLQRLEVSAPPGNPLGSVIQEWSCYKPQFRIENAQRETVLPIWWTLCYSLLLLWGCGIYGLFIIKLRVIIIMICMICLFSCFSYFVQSFHARKRFNANIIITQKILDPGFVTHSLYEYLSTFRYLNYQNTSLAL